MWLSEQIETIKQRDPAATSTLEVLLTYPGLHALIFHRASSALRHRDLPVAARLVSHVGRFLTGIEIHPGAAIGRRLFIDHGMGVVIGETAIVGDDVTMYQGVTLGGTGKQRGKRHPTVGNGVVIGAGAKILGAVTIGDGAKIGGGAVVLKDVPPYTTAVGVPARAVAWTHPESGVSRRLEQMPDPQYDSMLAMIQRIEEQEERIRALTAEVEEKESTLAGSWQI
ncbi:MAG TPA: serine O-acetyltransferase EpsC [Thermomicrobiales bacterium]|nr:serine O-acetyltransferase EpsC [Thermomicrobiales bacterium]